MSIKKIHQGDIVVLLEDIGKVKAGELAYVYHEFNLEGDDFISIITKEGVDLPRFDTTEQDHNLLYVRHSDYIYNYRGADQLYWDFPEFIKPLFDDVKAIFADPDILIDKKY